MKELAKKAPSLEYAAMNVSLATEISNYFSRICFHITDHYKKNWEVLLRRELGELTPDVIIAERKTSQTEKPSPEKIKAVIELIPQEWIRAFIVEKGESCWGWQIEKTDICSVESRAYFLAYLYPISHASNTHLYIMSKVLIATEKPFAAPAVAGIKQILTEAGFEVVLLEKYTTKAELLAAVADVEAIIIRSDIIDAEVFDAAKQLKIVVRAGAGYDNVDLESATAHGVCVMNTPGQNANAVAELVFAMLLFGVRNRFNGTSGTELKDKKLGLLAYGNTGRNVARIAKGFGMDIYAYDPFTPAEVIEKEGVHAVASQKELFSTCDIVSLHIPATPETKGSIGRELVSLMP